MNAFHDASFPDLAPVRQLGVTASPVSAVSDLSAVWNVSAVWNLSAPSILPSFSVLRSEEGLAVPKVPTGPKVPMPLKAVNALGVPTPLRALARLAALSTLVALTALPTRSTLAQLTATPEALDFGSRGHNEQPSETVVLTNTTGAPVAIQHIAASCGCITLKPTIISDPLPAGGSVSLDISMSSGRAIGSLDKHVTITTDAQGKKPLVIPVRMRVFEGLSVEPRDLRFDGVCGGEPLTKTVDIAWKGRGKEDKALTVRVEGVRGSDAYPRVATARDNPHFSAKVTDKQDGKRIELTLKPTHPEGRIWANLEARVDGKLLVLPIAGEMFRWIKVVPTYFNFSRVADDDPSSFTKEVELTSTDGRQFQILSMTPTFKVAKPSGMRLEVELKEGKPGTPGTKFVLRGRIVPPPKPAGEGALKGEAKRDAPASDQGSFSGDLVVKTDHPGKPELKLTFFGFLAPPRK